MRPAPSRKPQSPNPLLSKSMAKNMLCINRFSIRALLCALSLMPLPALAADASPPPATAEQVRALDPREEAHLLLPELERRVAAGDIKAQTELGARYGQGYGVAQDIPKAISLLSAAAAKNDPDAQYFLGTAYSSGLGVPYNEAQAFTLYEQAAAQGNAPANFMVATSIIYGKGGIAPSWSGGMKYLWASAVKGYPPAMVLLGAAYQDGAGVDANPRAAAYWYRRTLSYLQDVRAIYNLRALINGQSVAWEPGDPGEPATAMLTNQSAAPVDSTKTAGSPKP